MVATKFRNVALEGDGQVTGCCLASAFCTSGREVEAGDHTIVLASPLTVMAPATRPLMILQRAHHRTLPVEDHRAPDQA